MRKSCVLLLCILFIGCAGCTGSPGVEPVPQQPVFSNGSVVTGGSWISMDPISDHRRGEPFTITGSTSLPAKSIIEVIIAGSASAANISTLDDCVTEKQKCVLYFAKVPSNTTGISRWSITTDDSMDLFATGSTSRYTAIVKNVTGDLSARSTFSLT